MKISKILQKYYAEGSVKMGINTLLSGKGAKKVVLTESEGAMPSLLPLPDPLLTVSRIFVHCSTKYLLLPVTYLLQTRKSTYWERMRDKLNCDKRH